MKINSAVGQIEILLMLSAFWWVIYLKNLNNKEFTISILIDLSKAFDTIDHNILLHKINNIGIRGNKYLIKNYLTDRYQIIRLYDNTSNNSILSQPKLITHGVPHAGLNIRASPISHLCE